VENETASDIPPSLQSAVPGKTKPPGPVSENPVDPDQKRPDGATYEFAVLPTPDYNEIMPIPMDETLPDGIIYKVQVAAYKSTKPQSFFRGLEPISAEHIGYAIRYFAGRFSFYEDARNALKTVKKQGFRDAFIVAYINGVKSTVDRARTLEPEFAARFRDPDAHASLKSEPAHPSSRVHFRIQLGAFSHEISNDHLNSFKEHAGSNIVSYIKNNEGLYIYTIGNFSTFEDASAFNDTLRMQGLTEAFVIGIKEGQKIPAAEAREMLEFE
jgi:hypothetical protein